MRTIYRWLLKTLIVVIIIVCLGLGSYFGCSSIYNNYIRKNIILKYNSKYYKFWSDTSKQPSTHLDFYFFNWTNPDDLNKPEKKPNLVQIGPYSFVEINQKVNITFHSNGTVSYFQRRFWYFDEKRSNGTLQDKVSLLNATLVSEGNIITLQPYLMKKSFSNLVKKQSKLRIIKRVGDLLIGYKEVSYFKHFNKFLYLSKRNGTIDGDNFNVATGEKNISQLGLLKKWNYKNTSSYFEKICNQIEGSIGNFWPPNPIDNEIKLFMPELCRALIYELDKKTDYMGMEGYKYTMDTKTLDNYRDICYLLKVPQHFEVQNLDDICEPKNISEDCYCDKECNPIGFINIGYCHYDGHIFFSLPHFYKTKPRLRDLVVGLNPNEEEHSFYIILEPNTGMPLEIAERLQINLLLQTSTDKMFLQNISSIYFPIFWYSKKIKLPEELAFELRDIISFDSSMLKSFIVIIISAILIYCLASGYYEFFSIGRRRIYTVRNEAEMIILDEY
ncbi:PREDICTED: protein croquemort-like [Polistes dominula]|uniref:Protein croquemort-like n=1 Tax=Polistes dominula TaxID=743375 RepID=A0ABM1HZW5_POLDO|nr:PREDICTED: protein croquemort-like [Polistes dominula]